jgi:hypothetical protein
MKTPRSYKQRTSRDKTLTKNKIKSPSEIAAIWKNWFQPIIDFHKLCEKYHQAQLNNQIS